jgi:hypothetical protein
MKNLILSINVTVDREMEGAVRALIEDLQRQGLAVEADITVVDEVMTYPDEVDGWINYDPTSYNQVNPFAQIYCSKCKRVKLQRRPVEMLHGGAVSVDEYRCRNCGHAWEKHTVHD